MGEEVPTGHVIYLVFVAGEGVRSVEGLLLGVLILKHCPPWTVDVTGGLRRDERIGRKRGWRSTQRVGRGVAGVEETPEGVELVFR